MKTLTCLFLLMLPLSATYLQRAEEVTAYIEKNYSLKDRHLYRRDLHSQEPDYMWGNGVMFSVLCGAATHDAKKYAPRMEQFFTAMDCYWDAQVKIPAYEPAPTKGKGNDKYYDDNAWMVLTFLEAYDITKNSRYFRRAVETQEFVWSGWDHEAGGGIWWHQLHKEDSKNTCANAPAAVGAYMIAQRDTKKNAHTWIERGNKIVDWTCKKLQREDALFADSINVRTQKINYAPLTYNTALMVRALLLRAELTGKASFRDEAIRVGKAADSLLNQEQNAYRDAVKWAHLMVEADLLLYDQTKDRHYYQRAQKNADTHYQNWQNNPPPDLLSQASIARELWLMVKYESNKNSPAQK